MKRIKLNPMSPQSIEAQSIIHTMSVSLNADVRTDLTILKAPGEPAPTAQEWRALCQHVLAIESGKAPQEFRFVDDRPWRNPLFRR